MRTQVSATATTKFIHVDVEVNLPSPLVEPRSDSLLRLTIELLEDRRRAHTRWLDSYRCFLSNCGCLRHIAIINTAPHHINPSAPRAAIPGRMGRMRRG